MLLVLVPHNCCCFKADMHLLQTGGDETKAKEDAAMDDAPTPSSRWHEILQGIAVRSLQPQSGATSFSKCRSTANLACICFEEL